MEHAPPVETCPRCGTFAALLDTGFVRVCAPCVEPSLHPIRRSGSDVVALLSGVWRVVREFGWLNALLVGSLTAPWLLVSPAQPSSFLLLLAVVLGSISLAEALAFCVWADRTLRGRAVEWRAVAPAFVRVLAVNLVLGVAQTVCVPLPFLFGPVASVVVLVALEGGGLVEGLETAWRRSAGRRVALLVGYLITLLPVLAVPVLVTGGAYLVALRRPGLGWEAFMGETAPLAVVSFGVGLLPSLVFQAAAWLATLPVPTPSPDVAPLPR
jgi:hypothetical protein